MDDNKCISCKLCERVCRGALVFTENGVEIDLSRCIKCGHCLAVCPTDALVHPLMERGELVGEIPTYEDASRFLRTARSVRCYKKEPVQREKLLKLLDIGRYPQTGANSQGISYLVVEGREKIIEILDAFCRAVDKFAPFDPELEWLTGIVSRYRTTGIDGVFRGCTDLIVALSDKASQNGRANAQFSLTFMALIAPTLNIGTCWAGIFERIACYHEYSAEIDKLLGVPEGKAVRGVLMAGIPDVSFRRLVERNPLEVQFR